MIYGSILERCPHVPTDGMDTGAWLDKRREAVGGSDAGALMGMNVYGSPLTVYLQKKNPFVERRISKAAVRGTRFERYIRDWTAEDFPEFEIEKVPYMFFDPEHPFMMANLDGVILAKTPVEIRGETVEGIGGHEIKTSEQDWGWGEDEIPDSYYCQVQHYLKVTGLPWFVVSVMIMCGAEDLRHYVVRRNDDFIARLVATEKDFWENFVQKDVMPPADGIKNEDDMITGMYEGSGGTLALSDAEAALCRRHRDLGERIKELEKQKDAAATDLKASLIGRSGGGKEKKLSAEGGGYSVSMSFYESRRADPDAMKKAGIFGQYSRVSQCCRMTVAGKKEGA